MALSGKQRLFVLVAFGLSGAAALAYEVLWTRSLSLTLGSTTHATATMLGTFMLGLAIGGTLGGRLADQSASPLGAFALCEFGIGLAALLSIPLLFRLPYAYLWLYQTLHLYPGLFYALQLAICGVIMLVPTILMGMTFPLAAKALTEELSAVGKRVGGAYTANTLGAVAGSFLAGFLLIPALGLTRSAIAAAFLNILAGAMLLGISRKGKTSAVILLGLVLVSMGWVATVGEKYSLFNFYSAFRYPEGLSYAEIVRQEERDMRQLSVAHSEEGTVRALSDAEGNLILQVGGKIEGTGEADLSNTRLLAQLPVASIPGSPSTLVIGLGAGVTVQAAKENSAKVAVVEINPAVVAAVRAHGKPGVLEGVHVACEDARRFLLYGEERYDVITSEPSYPTGASVGNLFTREFYEIAVRRLTEGGVFCQWIPYYLLTNDDVTMVLKTFCSVFPHARLFKIPESMDLLLLGSGRPFPFSPAEVFRRVEEMRGGVSSAGLLLSRNEEALRELAGDPSIPGNCDDRPLLEFRVVRNLRIGDLALAEGRGR